MGGRLSTTAVYWPHKQVGDGRLRPLPHPSLAIQLWVNANVTFSLHPTTDGCKQSCSSRSCVTCEFHTVILVTVHVFNNHCNIVCQYYSSLIKHLLIKRLTCESSLSQACCQTLKKCSVLSRVGVLTVRRVFLMRLSETTF